MALPDPEPGLVIRYAFLWGREAARGQEEGGKDRPCAVVLTAKREGEQTRVVVAPITHTPPDKDTSAVEIPAATKQRLGLDHERSWIITSEVNVFHWPGPDLRPVPRGRPSDEPMYAYGMLGPKTLTAMVQGVIEQRQTRQLTATGRDEETPAASHRDFWKQNAKQPEGPNLGRRGPKRRH